MERSDWSILRAYVINIYIYRTSSNFYTPDSGSLASLARQFCNTYFHIYIYIYIYLIGERAKGARHYQGCTNSSWCGIYIYILVMCSVSTNGERAGLANLHLTIGSLLECS